MGVATKRGYWGGSSTASESTTACTHTAMGRPVRQSGRYTRARHSFAGRPYCAQASWPCTASRGCPKISTKLKGTHPHPSRTAFFHSFAPLRAFNFSQQHPGCYLYHTEIPRARYLTLVLGLSAVLGQVGHRLTSQGVLLTPCPARGRVRMTPQATKRWPTCRMYHCWEMLTR